MDTELFTALTDYLKSHKVEDLDFELIESKLTSPIMLLDSYEELPVKVQDAIELLDTWEIQGLTQSDIQNCAEVIDTFISATASASQ